MANNPYPIQIKKRILFNLICSIVFVVAVILIAAIFSLTAAVYITIILSSIVIIGLLFNFLYLKSIEYSLDDKNFTFRGGVISRFEKFLPFSKIQHVVIYESFWQRLLGLSSVSIETAREGGFATNTYGQRYNVKVRTGPYIPDLKTEDAEKLKDGVISISNKKYKPVAGV